MLSLIYDQYPYTRKGLWSHRWTGKRTSPPPPPPIWLKKGSSWHACSDTSLRWLCSHLGSLVSHPLPLISPKCQKQLAWYYRDIGQQTQNTVVTKYTDGFVNIKYGDKQPKKPHIYFLWTIRQSTTLVKPFETSVSFPRDPMKCTLSVTAKFLQNWDVEERYLFSQRLILSRCNITSSMAIPAN